MHRLLILFFIAFISCFSSSYAQRMKPAEHMDSLNIRVLEVMKAGKSDRFLSTGQQFDSLWTGGSLSSSQKDRIYKLYSKMVEKQWRAKPFLYEVTSTLTSARYVTGLSVVQYDALLDQLEKGIVELSPKDFIMMTEALHTFMANQALNYTNFFKLIGEDAQFSLKYESVAAYVPTEESSEEEQQSSDDDWNTEPADDTENDSSEQESDDNWGSWDWGDSTDDSTTDDSSTDDDGGWSSADDVADNWGDNVIVEDENKMTLEERIDSFIQDDAPAIEGPYIHFDRVNLVFQTPFDSVVVMDVQGDFLLKEGIFVAYSGKMDWSSTGGWEENSPYCTFTKFHFNVRQPKFGVEKATLYYPEKLRQPTLGVFDFKSVRKKKNAVPSYPRFTSYGSDIELKTFIDNNFSYQGGFSLWGLRSSSNSIFGGGSEVKYAGTGNRSFRIASGLVEYTDSAFHVNNGALTIKYGRDSLYHPEMEIDYRQADTTLHALKRKGVNEMAPFQVTFFDMDIKADYLRWKLNQDSLDISIFQARDHRPAFFESRDYFNKKNYQSLTSIYGFHPLNALNYYSQKIRSKSFGMYDFAESIKKDPKIVQQAMFKAREGGFIDYDPETTIITVKDKTNHYNASFRHKKDYDDLTIPSRTNSAPNATLHLDEKKMTVRGINKFYISEKLDVYIQPESEQIDLIGKRDFTFNGHLFSGNFEFIGTDFVFRYDSFLIQLNKIDSIRFYLPDSVSGERRQVDNSLVSAEEQLTASLNSNMGATNGTLYINNPKNKSGIRQYPSYPRFDAERGAVVYFDNHSYLDKAYDRQVYFIIPPFSIDSLAGGDPSAIGFQGRFVSGGIFPDFEEKLSIMPDNSLGFVHKVPEEGYALYDTDGIIYDEVRLDKQGLQGKGHFELLSSKTFATKYTMYQDSMRASSSHSTIEAGDFAGISYPAVDGEGLELLWLPREDSLFLQTTETPIKIYEEGDLTGATVLTHSGLRGKGNFDIRGSETASDKFRYEELKWQAEEAQFNINSEDSTKATLYGDNVSVDFNLEENLAKVSPEVEGDAAISFPYAMTKTSITEANWDLDKDIITMNKPKEVDIKDSYFYSTRPDMDSLVFSAEGASYDIARQEMEVTGIPYITVADALISPDSSRITIQPNFVLPQLTNASLVIDTLNGYHNLIDGNINILSRKAFEGDASYRFVNAVQDTFNIKFNQFELLPDRKKQLHTESNGEIHEEDNLLISPGMYFKGTATMYATSKPLLLNGFVKLDLKNIPDYDTWIVYESNDEEQQEIIFDFASAITEEGDPLTAGIHFEDGTNQLYTTFIFEKHQMSDQDFFVPNGLLSYDREKGHYIVEDTMKTRGHSFAGKFYTYNEETSDITFEGKVDLMNNLNPKVFKFRLNASAIGSGNLNNNTVKFNGFTTIETILPSASLTSMANTINLAAEDKGLAKANDDLTQLFYKVSEIIGDRATKNYETMLSTDYAPLVKMSRKLQRGIVLSNFDMEWSQDQTAWYSVGNIGISNILGIDINAKTEGYLEVKKTVDGDIVNLFLSAGQEAWYYLNYNYSENRFSTYSADPVYNEAVIKKSNVDKAKMGEFIMAISDKEEVMNYVNRFRLIYLDIEEEFVISEPSLTEDSGDPFFDAGSLEEDENTENIIFSDDDESLYDDAVEEDENESNAPVSESVEQDEVTEDDGFGEEELKNEEAQKPKKEKKGRKRKGKKKKEEEVVKPEPQQEQQDDEDSLYDDEDDGF